MLTTTVLPVLTSSANPAILGNSVTFTAAMPTDATSGNMTFKLDGSTLGSPSLSAGSGSALQVDGSDGVSTNLTLDPGANPAMTVKGVGEDRDCGQRR